MSWRVRVSKRTDSSSVQHSHFLNLPPEVTEHIISHLRVNDLNCLRLVSRKVCDTVDRSSVWKRTWISLQSSPESGSDMWKLLQIRRIISLDLSEIDRSAEAVRNSLQALPELQELCMNSWTLFYLGFFHIASLLEYVRTLEVSVRDILYSHPALRHDWIPLVPATLPNITKLTIHNLRTKMSEFVEKITPLDNLEVLDLEVADTISTSCAVDTRDFTKLLYLHPNLTDLRIHQMALKSAKDASPFDPRTCPSDFGERALQLKSLDLRLVLTDANINSPYQLLRTSDLQYMPHLERLKYSMSCPGLRNTLRGYSLARYIELEDWNATSENAAVTELRLEYLHIELFRGVTNSVPSISMLENLPITLKYFSLCGEIEDVSKVISAIGISLGATLTELKLHPSVPLNNHQLCHISKTFVVLRYLTASLCVDIKPASILMLEQLASLRRLTLTTPVIPNTTIHDTRASMTREFMIIPVPPNLD